MFVIEGKWYAKESAKQHDASLHSDTQEYWLYVDGIVHTQGKTASLLLNQRLGNISRRITLEDGSVFTTKEHDAIMKLFGTRQQANRLLHSLESKLSWVLGSFVLLLLSIYIFVTLGIPFFSEKIAYALPLKTNELLTQQTMKVLDKHLFKRSDLPIQRQIEITEHFQNKVLPLLPEKENFNYHLNFRLLADRNTSLPNAMALPSGEIIVTDKFVELCQNYEELDSILLHEVGHVIHRDSLTMLVEGTFVSVSVMIALGDLNGFAEMGVGLGSLLLNMHYSRDHEQRADLFAYEEMLKNHQDPIAFAAIMNKMELYMQKTLGKETPLDPNEYISTHPQTKERIALAKHYSECFKNSLTLEKCRSTSKNP